MYFKRVREIREDNDLYQKNVADILKISKQQYQLYESGKRDFPIDLLVEFSKYFNVSLDYIVGLSNFKERRYWDYGYIFICNISFYFGWYHILFFW